MATPQERLDAMLNDYQTRFKTAHTDPGAGLKTLVDTTPGLKTTLLQQIERGSLERFDNLGTPGALGTYNAYSKTMAVSIDQLNDASRGNVQTANSLRFTLAHEIDHAVTRDARLAEDRKLQSDVAGMVATPSPHDYTGILRSYNESVRSREVHAEMTGFNALAAHVRAGNPHATLKDLYDASPADMQMYVNVDLSKTPATYAPKPGLTLGADLSMASTPENVAAMGRYFYEANGYPERKIGSAASYIDGQERTALAAVRAADPTHPHPAPEVKADLTALGVPRLALPAGMTDSSPRLAPPAHTPPETGSGPSHSSSDPRQVGHADHAYFQALRERLPESVPDNAVAQAMLLAKREGLTDFSRVNPQEVGVSNGTVWIGGNTPGFRVAADVSQAPPMEQVSRDLQGQQASQTPAVQPDPARSVGQEPQAAVSR
ncbi:MAG: hypothetical protein ACTHOH_13350 [Lysobacteraceae bacterium]